MIRRALLVLMAAVAVAGCSILSINLRTPPTATVDSTVVGQRLYDVLLSSAKHQAAAAGAGIDPSQSAGARHLARIEAAAMRTALRDTELDRLAADSGITISDQEVDAALSRVAAALGADTSLEALLAQTGMSQADFRLIMRYRLLEQKLRARDAGLDRTINRALSNSEVKVYAAPCQDDHRYPQCLDAGVG